MLDSKDTFISIELLCVYTTLLLDFKAPVKETPVPPTIVTSDATEEENVADAGQHNNDDDIDQAFATYGIDLHSRKLGDQFNMVRNTTPLML